MKKAVVTGASGFIGRALTEKQLWASALADSIAFNTVLFTNVFGVGDRSNRSANAMLRKLLAGEPDVL